MPTYSASTLAGVFSKTAGQCSYCGTELWRNKVDGAGKGAWSVDRWRPRSRCRTTVECDAFENLWAVCPSCRNNKGETTGSEYLWSRHASKDSVLALWHAWLKDMED